MEKTETLNIQNKSNSRIAKNTIVLYLRMIVLMVTSLYTSRVILASLGIDDFGIYNVVGGVVTCLGFLNGTLSTASSRYITVALGRGDMQKMKETFSSVLIVNFMLALVVLLLSETVGLWFLCEKMNIPVERTNAALWVYQISIITVIVNIISVPYNATIIAHERMKAFAYITLFDGFAKLAVAYFISIDFSYDKLIVYAILLLLIQLTDRLVYGQYCVSKFEETKFHFYFDKSMLKDMSTFVGWSAYGSLVSAGFTQGLNILLNIFFSPAINAARGIAVQVQNTVNSFVINFQTAINPQLTKSVSVNNFEYSRSLLIASSKFSFFLMCILGIPIITNVDFILGIWLKEVPGHSDIFIQLMLVVCLFQTLANSLRIVNQAEGNIKKFQLYECTYLALIVPCSYVCLKLGFEPEIVFVVQLIIEITAQFIRIHIVLPKIQMRKRDYMINVYARIVLVFVLALLFSGYLHSFLNDDFIGFVINVLLTEIVIVGLIFLMGLSYKEKTTFLNLIKNHLLCKGF